MKTENAIDVLVNNAGNGWGDIKNTGKKRGIEQIDFGNSIKSDQDNKLKSPAHKHIWRAFTYFRNRHDHTIEIHFTSITFVHFNFYCLCTTCKRQF